MALFEDGFGDGAGLPEPTVVTRMRKLRAEQRYSCHLYAHAIQDGFEVPCYVVNISAGGVQIKFDSLSVKSIYDKALSISIPGIGQYPAVFRWRSGTNAGLHFKISSAHRLALRARLLDKFDPS
ncbi:PilZ domain-containing protein [Primorskyibacter sp. 2E233]|uniref:PilZ domain-containing protein n=1 Tax=Primorskyibacter sp. 2E233 TaxID=3413431 RepID=UPI003BF13D5B